MKNQYSVRLRSCGNPDHGQYGPVSDPEIVRAETLADVVAAVRDYIDRWNLGGGNWINPPLKRDGKKIGVVRYSGWLVGMNGEDLA